MIDKCGVGSGAKDAEEGCFPTFRTGEGSIFCPIFAWLLEVSGRLLWETEY